MTSGWRATARLITAALAAAAVSRATESARRLIAEVATPPELSGPMSRPATPAMPQQPLRLAAAPAPGPAAGGLDIAAQAEPPHEFGPVPAVRPSHGIGFRSEPRVVPIVAEMPIISRPPSREPAEDPEPEWSAETQHFAPAAAVVVSETLQTAASIVQELDEDEIDDVAPAEPGPDPEPTGSLDEVEADEPEAVEDESAEIEPAEAIVEVLDIRPEPVRALRLTAPPVEDTVIDPEDQAPVIESHRLRETIETPDEPSTEEAVPHAKPAKTKQRRPKKSVKKAAAKDKRRDDRRGKHRRRRSAVSGVVRSSRGRGLRGLQVAVVDDKQKVVGTAVTGAGGVFVVEELPAGTYRVTATDEAEGDFGAGWHAGASFDQAAMLKVKHGKTRRKTDVVLRSTSAVELEVDVRKKKAVVDIAVTERATGTPADGSVRVSTKLFSVELPLTDGQAAMTLFGSASGSPALSKKVTVDYLGTEHTLGGAARAKLRKP